MRCKLADFRPDLDRAPRRGYQPTSSGIKGICKFISAAEATGQLKIGQGSLLYHREWERHPFLTLADIGRTGDDFARFHFQNRLGITLFGLHGSYIVVRNDVEKATGGFDFGPRGDITEDAFWAMKAMQLGIRCAWVEGYLEEQSCMSFSDFLRQRRRWFQGLVQVALHAPVAIRWRLALALNTLLWGLAPFAMFYTLGNLAHHVTISPVVRVLASYSFATFATLYITGLAANMDEHGITSWSRRIFLTVKVLLLLPVFAAMEGLGVLCGALEIRRGDLRSSRSDPQAPSGRDAGLIRTCPPRASFVTHNYFSARMPPSVVEPEFYCDQFRRQTTITEPQRAKGWIWETSSQRRGRSLNSILSISAVYCGRRSTLKPDKPWKNFSRKKKPNWRVSRPATSRG